LLLLSATTLAQTRQRTTHRKGRSSAAGSAQPVPNAARTGKERVGEQVKSLTNFLYLLGPISKEIESAEASAQGSQSSPAASEQMARNKEKLRAAFQNVLKNMDQLEIDFRTTPALQPYYTKLVGVAAGAEAAESQAASNHFTQAGRSLLAVANRLTDVLVEMR
jgi:GTP1/Obg family GTP-binding protein